MKTVTGLKRVCLFNPANGDRVNLNSISATSEYVQEVITTETGTGVISGGDDITLNVAFFDNPAGMRAQLEAWENADTPLCLVALFETGALLWNVAEPITGFIDSLEVNARDGVSPFRFSIQHIGFDPDIYFGINILRTAMKRNNAGRTQYNQQQDYIPLRRTTSGADRFQLRATTNDGLRQTVGGTGTIRFPFPFPNVPLNFSCDTDGGPSQSTISAQLFNDTVVNSLTVDNDGANNVFTPQAGAFWFAWAYPNDQIINATLRISGTEYVNG